MEGVIEDLRARLRSTAPGAARRDLSEVRLEVACTWGSGHLLVTGSDRAEVDSLLDRVIRKTDPMGTIRARAGDPASTVDRLIDLLDSESEVTGHLDRRRALLQLLARAQEARKSIFVVVDDADAATVEQLEKLRMTIEVAPDALERLRLVLVGSSTLPAKLDAAGARALSSRITSRIRVGAPEEDPLSAPARRGPLAALASQGFSWTFATAAAIAFAVISYATVLLLAAPETARFDRIALEPTIAPAAIATPRVAPVATAAVPSILVADEGFLRSTLEIATDPRWVTGSALFGAPVIPAESAVEIARAHPPAPPPPPKAVANTQKPASSIRSLASVVTRKPTAPTVAVTATSGAATGVAKGTEPSEREPPAPLSGSAAEGSSIALLRSHFD
jgi:hypothetical protein